MRWRRWNRWACLVRRASSRRIGHPMRRWNMLALPRSVGWRFLLRGRAARRTCPACWLRKPHSPCWACQWRRQRSTGLTRCSPSCRCRRGCRWARWRLAKQARSTPLCLQLPSWRINIPPIATHSAPTASNRHAACWNMPTHATTRPDACVGGVPPRYSHRSVRSYLGRLCGAGRRASLRCL
jgi:hypothetical protein